MNGNQSAKRILFIVMAIDGTFCVVYLEVVVSHSAFEPTVRRASLIF